MEHFSDDRIKEASGLAFSRTWADLAYTCSDENGIGFAIRPSTGATVGTFRARDISMHDPEAMSCDFKGALWWCDIGDNDGPGDSAIREWVNVYRRGEPGPGDKGSLKFTHYRLKYPSGTPHNAETFLTWPDGKKQIISKEASGTVYQLPTTLQTGAFNTMTSVATGLPSFIADGAVSKDGKWVFLLRKDQFTTIYVFDTSWTQVGTISMDAMDKPEGITVAANGKSLWVCDDDNDSNGKLQNVKIDGQWCPAGSKKYDDDTPVVGADPAPAPPLDPCA